MKTIASIFSGGGGWEIGAMAAGYTPIWGVENDAAIAEVYEANVGAHVLRQDARTVDPRTLEASDVLVASPPCQAHSNARSKKLAPRDDEDAGLCVLDYVRVLRPKLFMLENVEGFKRSATYKAIFHGLHALGYFVSVTVLNAADFGVPQTRRRLILRASRLGMLPVLPLPTAWLGWHQAIEDLIDGLPESKFADWQLARLPESLSEFLISGAGNTNFNEAYPGRGIRHKSEPAQTINAISQDGGFAPRAFLVGNQSGSDEKYLQIAEAESPAIAVTASLHTKGKMPHAFIVRASDQRENCDIARPQDDPIWTLTEGNTAHGRVKAYLVTDQHDAPSGVADRAPRMYRDSEPSGPVVASHKIMRAWLDSGRVVAMNVRALARFQAFPDSYRFPEGKGTTGLACRIIGNAVPPLEAQALCKAVLV